MSVRFLDPEHPAIPRTVRGRLEAEIATLAGQVAGGFASDWGDYKERVGVLKGLHKALDHCADAERDLREG